MKPEVWKDVVGFEGFYEVSNRGRVKSQSRIDRNNHPVKERIKSTRPNHDGHIIVNLNKDGARTTKYVHHLVLEAFVSRRPRGMECCHNDGDPKNNHVSNLRWDTHLNNIRDCVQHGTHTGGLQPRRVQRSDGVTFASLREAARTMGIDSGGICMVCKGKAKSYKGFQWKYV